MELVTIKTKFQVVIPQSIRKRCVWTLGSAGSVVRKRKITFTPKSVVDGIWGRLEDIAQGRTHGPYKSATAAISALERRRENGTRARGSRSEDPLHGTR